MLSTISKYQIVKELGEGGMGKVYLGYNDQSGTFAAIKELHAFYTQNEEIRTRFHREAMTMSYLNHPYIVKFYEFLEKDNSLYLVMEYAEGRTLDQYIEEVTGPLPEEKAIELIDKILEAFSYAHNRKVVHRDIKPSNIVILKDSSIKILDFGVAKILDTTDVKSTTIGTVIGTGCYMSPEQAQGLTIDTRTDIYALGILLFYILSGKAPFDTNKLSDFDLRLKVTRDPLPKVRDVYPHSSDHMQAVIDKATKKNVTHRFQNCEEFRKGLEQNKNKKNTSASFENRDIKIGRAGHCDITIDNSLVSRLHGIISAEKGKYFYKDVSVNKTLINGIIVHNEKVILEPEDNILLAGEIPLSWDQISIFFTPAEIRPSKSKEEKKHPPPRMEPPKTTQSHTQISVPKIVNRDLLLIVAFALLLPPIGWIIFFLKHKKAPVTSQLAGILGTIGMIVYLILISYITN